MNSRKSVQLKGKVSHHQTAPGQQTLETLSFRLQNQEKDPTINRQSTFHHIPYVLDNRNKNAVLLLFSFVFVQPPDSSSNTSSCNSSTPSSPAVQQTHTPHSNLKSQFHFPGAICIIFLGMQRPLSKFLQISVVA